MLDEINSRGFEIFVAILLILGKANIVASTLNKEQGFFTLNVGSDLFEWRKPLVVSTSTTPMQQSPVSSQTQVIPKEPYPYATLNTSNTSLSRENGEVDKSDSDITKIILFGIFILSIFLFEDPFVATPNSTT